MDGDEREQHTMAESELAQELSDTGSFCGTEHTYGTLPISCAHEEVKQSFAETVTIEQQIRLGRDLANYITRCHRSKLLPDMSILQQPWERPDPLQKTWKRIFDIGSGGLSRIPAAPVEPVVDEVLVKRPKLPLTARRLSMVPWPRCEDLLRQKALLRWRIIIETDLEATTLGTQLEETFTSGLDDSELVSSLEFTFAKKATATLVKRSSSILAYMQWAKRMRYEHPLRVTEKLIFKYLLHMKDNSASPTAPSSFISALRFAVAVVGLKLPPDALGPRVLGLASMMYQRKRPLKQSKVLTVRQVWLLEQVVLNSTDTMARTAAGYFLMCLFAAARFKDGMFLESMRLEMGDETFGFIEAETGIHKTANTDQRKTTFLPIVSFALVVGACPWAPVWMELRKQQGLDHKAFILPAPMRNGTWGCRPLTSGEGSQWLRELLFASGSDDVGGISSHSLKSTFLSWASKGGLLIEHRRILGHHLDPQYASAVTYSRDAMAGPLNAMAKVLDDIRQGLLQPDLSRAHRAVAVRAERSDALGTELPIPTHDSLGSWIPCMGETNEASDLPVEEPADDEADSSSSSGEESTAEEITPCEEASLLHEISDRAYVPVSQPGLYINQESGLGHLMNDEYGIKFKCGKLLTRAYRPPNRVGDAVHMCLRCFPVV